MSIDICGEGEKNQNFFLFEGQLTQDGRQQPPLSSPVHGSFCFPLLYPPSPEKQKGLSEELSWSGDGCHGCGAGAAPSAPSKWRTCARPRPLNTSPPLAPSNSLSPEPVVLSDPPCPRHLRSAAQGGWGPQLIAQLLLSNSALGVRSGERRALPQTCTLRISSKVAVGGTRPERQFYL